MSIDEHLPLSEATFFILLSLATGEKHGYAILKEVEALSQGRVTLSTGTLYGALGRLLDQAWIERTGEDDEDESGRPRKAYRLTDLGRKILSAETNRMEVLVRTVRMRFAREGA